MDILTSFTRKSLALNQENLQPIVKKLQKSIHSLLLQSTDPRGLGPALRRSATFDLSYLLIRHRQWHHAALLPELAIDFLNSEYHIPASISALMVESALDILHNYTPRELDWLPEDYENEFLEHLIICSLISLDEESLEIDLGFGKNVLGLLKNALALDEASEVFEFAPEITHRLHVLMQKVFGEIEAAPENMDLYRIKNILQRDGSTPKNRLKKDYLAFLHQLLMGCWPKGKTAEDLQKAHPSDLFSADLRLLLRNGLVYEEPQARKNKGPLYRLSNKGHELTCMQFAFSRWQDLGHHLHLADLPSPYQATLLQILAKESAPRLQALIEKEGQHLSPVALRFVIDHMKRHNGEKGLLEIFSKLLHNHAHAWIRAEICQALPLPGGESMDGLILEDLLNHDPSPMVRSAARTALQRQRRKLVPAPESNM